jgi:uncharacterized protein YkwD
MKNIGKTLKHFFIPHRGNAFRPHALRHKSLTVYSALLIFSQLMFGATMMTGPTITSADAKTVSTNIIVKTNEQRTKASLSPLTENAALSTAAAAKLSDMFAKGYWDHTGPSGETAWQFVDAAGYKYQLAGENLAKGFDNSGEVVGAWMDSPTHRENILNSQFTDIGVAVGSGKIKGANTTVIVQMFGLPKTTFASAPVTSAQVLGTAKLMPEVNLSNAQIPSKLPYLAIWALIFGLVIVDGVMIRRLGLHASKSHVFNFRVALLMVALGIGVLMIGVVGIA